MLMMMVGGRQGDMIEKVSDVSGTDKIFVDHVVTWVESVLVTWTLVKSVVSQ